MKWNPQPKDNCAREDCTKDATQAGYCMNHYHLFRRNGVPYRQDEIFEMSARNTYESRWDQIVAEDPPSITWVRRGPIWVAASVEDPHAEIDRYAARTHCRRGHEFTPENTVITKDGRQCGTCKRHQRKRRELRERAVSRYNNEGSAA